MEKTYEEKEKSLRRGSIIWAIVYGISLVYSHNLITLIPLAILLATNILISQRNKTGAILEMVFGGILIGSGILCLIGIITIIIAFISISGMSTGLIGTMGSTVGVVGILFYGLFAVLFITAGISTIKEGKWFENKLKEEN